MSHLRIVVDNDHRPFVLPDAASAVDDGDRPASGALVLLIAAALVFWAALFATVVAWLILANLDRDAAGAPTEPPAVDGDPR